MKEISLGEGRRSFPYFFILLLLSLLVLDIGLSPEGSRAQKSGKDGLSLFDRLAEEATLLNKRGQTDRVISLLEPHKGDKKNDSALFFNELGYAYRQKGRMEEAIQSYQKSLSLDPQNPVIMENLAVVFYLNKEYSQAVELCQKVVKSNPRFHQAHSTLGLAYYRLGKYREAMEEFEIVLNLDPQDEQAKNFHEAARKKIQEKK